MNSIATRWTKQTPNIVEFSTGKKSFPKCLTRKVVPSAQERTLQDIERHRSGTIRSNKQLLEDHSYIWLPSENSVITEQQKHNDKRLCSVRAGIITFVIVLLLIVAAGTSVGIVFATIKSQNSTATGNSNGNNAGNSYSTISTGLLTSSVSIGSQTGSPCSAYTTINDPSRSITRIGSYSTCDNGPIFNTTNGGAWIRFIGTGGTAIPVTSPGLDHCGGYLAGWFNGTLSMTPSAITNGVVCFETYADLCGWSANISVVYCPGSYYIFFLPPLSVCNARYCTV